MKRLLFSFLLALIVSIASASAAGPIRVLLIDGQSNHDWKATSPLIKAELLSSGMFTVDIATTPPAGSSPDAWKAFSPDFAGHDVVLLNYYGEDWPAATLAALESYVRNGGGLAAFHAGGSSFEKDAEYNRMIGMAWRKKDFGPALALGKDGKTTRIEKGAGMDSGHGANQPFMVDTRAPDHPIMRGFPPRFEHLSDELYHSLRGPCENVEILATALSPITGLNEPMAWTVKYGKGRVFYCALGHNEIAIECLSFQNLMARGLEWASTGAVAGNRLLKPFAETIRAHLDPNVKINGPYAVIKLPITRGVQLHNPTSVAVGPGRTMYATNYTGEIMRLVDTDGDGLEDTAALYADVTKDGKQYPYADATKWPGVPSGGGLRYPTALAFKGNDCYVATTQEIRIYTDTKGTGAADASRTFATGWPFTMHYFDWTFGLAFGPDGYLYTNICTDYINPHPAPDPKGLRGAMLRISPDGKTIERFAYGLRFSYGVAINEAGDVFCTDNEGGGNPTEELNHIVKGGNYGHHPKLPTGPPIPPVVAITPHLSTDGLTFNPSTNDFGGTGGDAFIALWGPDGQYERGGITRVRLTRKPDGTYSGVETRFSEGPPKMIDLCFGPQGDLYGAHFGHDQNPGHCIYYPAEGDIYRIIYTPGYHFGSTGGPSARLRDNPLKAFVAGSPSRGQQTFEQRQCMMCHTVDGSGTKLGPDLKNVWATFGRPGVMESIVDPSKVIASGYDTCQLKTKSGETIIGRMLSSDESQVTLMLTGNTQRTVSRDAIASLDILPMSMMPPGLINGMSEAQVNDLFAYMRSLGTGGDGAVRIKSGGQAVTDGSGVKWDGDAPYTPGFYGNDGGNIFTLATLGDSLLKTARFGDFQYRFDVDGGDYDVTVVTSEPYFHGAGQRVFSISANDEEMVKNLDPFAEAGFGKPVRRSFRVHVSGNQIVLKFTATANLPLVNAVEVKPAARPGEN